MEWNEFSQLLTNNLSLFFLCLFISVIGYFFIFKKFYISIIDPLAFQTFFSMFGCSVVFFLYLTSSIKPLFLISYLSTQIAFFFGLLYFKSLSKKDVLSSIKKVFFLNEIFFVYAFFILTSFFYVSIQLLSYKLVGIPLLMGKHVDVYSHTGGLGSLGRFIDVLKPVSIYLLIYFLFNKTSSFAFKLYKYVFLFFVLLFFALSGSKGDFMTIAFYLFIYIILNGNQYNKYFTNIKNYERLVIVVGMFFAFGTILLTNEGYSLSSAFDTFIFRLVASGDTYHFAYVNNNIHHINGEHPFLALFGDFLATIRLIPRTDVPEPMGYTLFKIFYPDIGVAGPNARHNVFGYVYFGLIGSVLFSFLLGFFISFFRNKMFFVLRKNLIGQIFFAVIYVILSGAEGDPPATFSGIEMFLLIFPILIFITIPLSAFLRMNNKTKISFQ